jgi:hypothetical protein
MSYGPKQVFTGGVIASAASTGTFLDLSDKSFTKMAVKYPTMSTAAMLTVYGSESATGTYLPVFERVNTAPVQHQALTIATSTSGAWAVFDAVPFRYVKFVASATVTDGSGAITVILQD